MCGIVGIYDLTNNQIDRQVIKKMASILQHRGPDDEGFYFNNNIGLGHRRLSIIDLSAAGHQPMTNEDNSIWLIFNGEIYNYLELIPDLKSRGHIFKSHCDTEVIIHAYEEYGEACLNKFNGMWAFALWDNKNKKLFCARDRFGVKPFYYYFQNNQFIFASEIKAFLQNYNISKQPNNQIIFDYLLYGLMDHTEETFFQNIKQLCPAHYLIVNKSGIQINKYWDLNEKNEIKLPNDEEYSQKFYWLFKDSIMLRLRSDVPIGTCLSGGLDSSSIVCVVNQLLKEGGVKNLGDRQKTFTSCFNDKKYDERQFSKEVIKVTGAEENLTFPNPVNLFNEMEKIVWYQDEPFGSTSIYAQWCVIELTKNKGIKVLLDGQGGDEVTGGYHPYFHSYFAELLRRLNLFRLINEVISYHKIHKYTYSNLIRELMLYFLPTKFHNTLAKEYHLKKDNFINQDFFNKYWRVEPKIHKYKGIFKNTLYNFLTVKILPSLLHYEDRNSMAHSIEARVPFLDYRLVEFMYAVPDEQKIKNGETKRILRNAMKSILPDKVRTRSDKMGFVTPEDIWFRTNLKNQIYEIINSKTFKSREFFNFEGIQEALNLYYINKVNISTTIWRWINIELWFRKFID